LVNGIMPTP